MTGRTQDEWLFRFLMIVKKAVNWKLMELVHCVSYFIFSLISGYLLFNKNNPLMQRSIFRYMLCSLTLLSFKIVLTTDKAP